MAAPDFISASTLTPGVIVAVLLPTSEAAIYTVPSARGVKVATATLCNTTGAAVTVSLSLVPNGGTAGALNRVIANLAIAAYDTQSLRDYLAGAMLAPGDLISGVATATGVSLVVSGAVAA